MWKCAILCLNSDLMTSASKNLSWIIISKNKQGDLLDSWSSVIYGCVEHKG